MLVRLKAKYASESENFDSSEKIVKLVIPHKHEEQDGTQGEESASFEETMLPHMDAAHNSPRESGIK
jgi:hypothetical protein